MTGISAAVITATCSLFWQQAAYAATDTVTRPADQAVLAAYRKMEEADRQGDGVLWLALRDRATLGAMNDALKAAIRKGGHSRPSVQYEPLAARAAGDRSAILGKVTDREGGTVQYEAVLFVLEDSEWKVAREQWSEKPFDPFVLYAMLEPPDGTFVRDGSPWKLVPYASSNWDVVRKEDVVWKVQATFDESFLYLRYESTQPLPAAGSKLRPNVGKTGSTGGPPAPPAMQIKSSGASLYIISVDSLVSTASAVDAKGKPAGERYSVVYTLSVKKSEGDEVFSATIGEGSRSLLLAVRDRFIDIRIPLGGLAGAKEVTPAIDLEEAGPVNRVLPYHVQPYSR
jgi:hypothetical protein